jgi:hypothetical protein
VARARTKRRQGYRGSGQRYRVAAAPVLLRSLTPARYARLRERAQQHRSQFAYGLIGVVCSERFMHREQHVRVARPELPWEDASKTMSYPERTPPGRPLAHCLPEPSPRPNGHPLPLGGGEGRGEGLSGELGFMGRVTSASGRVGHSVEHLTDRFLHPPPTKKQGGLPLP